MSSQMQKVSRWSDWSLIVPHPLNHQSTSPELPCHHFCFIKLPNWVCFGTCWLLQDLSQQDGLFITARRTIYHSKNLQWWTPCEEFPIQVISTLYVLYALFFRARWILPPGFLDAVRWLPSDGFSSLNNGYTLDWFFTCLKSEWKISERTAFERLIMKNHTVRVPFSFPLDDRSRPAPPFPDRSLVR